MVSWIIEQSHPNPTLQGRNLGRILSSVETQSLEAVCPTDPVSLPRVRRVHEIQVWRASTWETDPAKWCEKTLSSYVWRTLSKADPAFALRRKRFSTPSQRKLSIKLQRPFFLVSLVLASQRLARLSNYQFGWKIWVWQICESLKVWSQLGSF